jgi:alpha-1,3-glucan synthase
VAAANLSVTQDEFFLRDAPLNGLDSVAFHYSFYRALSRFLGMDGNLQVAYDVDVNFVTAWNQMFVDNDFINPSTGRVDPKHMYGTSNFDVFRWPSLEMGIQKSVLATFLAALVMPGIPLVRVILVSDILFQYGLLVLLRGGAKFLSVRQRCF